MTLARARLRVAGSLPLALAVASLAAGCGGLTDPVAPGGLGGRGGGGGGGAGGGSGSGYGVPVQGFPGWRERALLVLTNAVRLAPLEYRARYAADFSPSLSAAGALAAYPAVGPVRWNLGLNQSARAHSLDMATTPCWGHDSCDGTSWSARIHSYYSLSGGIGENIAAGYPGPSDPRYAMNMWLCDAPSGGSACCADGAACDGHRRNMMSAGWQALGTGYAYADASPYRNYWTQDFGQTADGTAPPLVDGSHIHRSGQVVFLATYVDAAAPRSLTLVVDGSSVAMAVDVGSPGRGTWSAALPSSGSCRSYHFAAVDSSGASWRYPSAGELRTAGDGGCTEDWRP